MYGQTTRQPSPFLPTRYDQKEDLVTRFEETGIAMGDPDADLDALLEEQAALQAKIEDADAWNLQVTCVPASFAPAFRGVDGHLWAHCRRMPSTLVCVSSARDRASLLRGRRTGRGRGKEWLALSARYLLVNSRSSLPHQPSQPSLPKPPTLSTTAVNSVCPPRVAKRPTPLCPCACKISCQKKSIGSRSR